MPSFCTDSPLDYKIKKGVNEMSAMKQAAKSKTCKCLTGWKKSVNKATGKSECNKVTYAIFNAFTKRDDSFGSSPKIAYLVYDIYDR